MVKTGLITVLAAAIVAVVGAVAVNAQNYDYTSPSPSGTMNNSTNMTTSPSPTSSMQQGQGGSGYMMPNNAPQTGDGGMAGY